MNAHNAYTRSFMIHPILIFLAAVLVCSAIPAEEGQWKFITGLDYSTGDYNDSSDTEMIYTPFGVGYKSGSWSGKITTGWLYLDGPGSVVDGDVIPVSKTKRYKVHERSVCLSV